MPGRTASYPGPHPQQCPSPRNAPIAPASPNQRNHTNQTNHSSDDPTAAGNPLSIDS